MSLDSTNLKDEISIKAKPVKFSFLNHLNLDYSVVNKLTLNLNRVLTGSDEIYFTPIGKDNDPASLLSDLTKILSKGSNSISSNLQNLEQSNLSKFGPRSLAKPWFERKESLFDYFKHRKTSFELSKSAKEPGFKPNLRPLSVSSASKFLKRSTNSGLPYYTNKGSVVDEVVGSFSSLLLREDPCVLFTRTQEGGKTRNVWGYPIADTLNEMRYYQPLLAHQRKQNYRAALLGPDSVDEAISLMMKYHNKSTHSLISIDFSSYDASVGKYLQEGVFDYIKALFQSSSNSDLDYIAHRFNTIGIITPDGLIEGSHGVPSGATFTNEVDSLAQYLVALSTGIECRMQIQGDDGAYLIPDSEVNALYNAFGESGLNVNVDKSVLSKDHIIYLQRLYDPIYERGGFIGGIYSLYRALNRIIYQERYSDFMDYSLKGSDYYSIRTITILENCKYHPLFEDFVRFVASKDKYLLKFSPDSVTKYTRMLNSGTGTGGLLINQYGDNLKGISRFETVKILNSLR